MAMVAVADAAGVMGGSVGTALATGGVGRKSGVQTIIVRTPA
ncbi:hypothetical protein [Sphingomonas montana]|nr:hypothetical protein [Sphingomonas montana]